jgi:ABC-2 type transport system ATP-binding protein
MPQSLNLSSNLTAKEMLEFYAKIYGANEETFKQRFSMLDELLEFPSDDQLIGKCSGGEKRRISLAAAFIHDPNLILLDE